MKQSYNDIRNAQIPIAAGLVGEPESLDGQIPQFKMPRFLEYMDLLTNKAILVQERDAMDAKIADIDKMLGVLAQQPLR